METINTTVNFEDLFDFSPEPVDRVAAAAAGNGHHEGSNEDRDKDVFADFDAVIAGATQNRNSSTKLSASVPSNWSGASTTPSSSGDNKFTVGSVGQLLNDLPEPTLSAPEPVPVKSKRGRKPGQKSLRTDMKTKLERSRQSARECRARKKLRYQYLDDLILEREKANEVLREELSKYQKWCHELDKGRIPDGLEKMLKEYKLEKQQPSA